MLQKREMKVHGFETAVFFVCGEPPHPITRCPIISSSRTLNKSNPRCGGQYATVVVVPGGMRTLSKVNPPCSLSRRPGVERLDSNSTTPKTIQIAGARVYDG